jgi:hypothetical protein
MDTLSFQFMPGNIKGLATHQRDVCSQTHPVDVTPCGAVVESVEDNRELLEELYAVVRAEKQNNI